MSLLCVFMAVRDSGFCMEVPGIVDCIKSVYGFTVSYQAGTFHLGELVQEVTGAAGHVQPRSAVGEEVREQLHLEPVSGQAISDSSNLSS
jgi:hypothetical protein